MTAQLKEVIVMRSKRALYADLLTFLGPRMGPLNLSPNVMARLSQGGVRLCVWGGPHFDQPQGWNGLIDEVRQAAHTLKQRPRRFRLVGCQDDLQDIDKTRLVYTLMTVQNPDYIGGNLERLAELYQAGVRIIQVAYAGQGPYGAGFMVDDDQGLTSLGRQFLAEAWSQGFVLDLAHAGPITALQAARAYNGRPIMVSHAGAGSVFPSGRNVSDELMKIVADRGGLVGLFDLTFFLHATDNTLKAWRRHLKHMVKVVGTVNLAIGSDAPVGGFYQDQPAKAKFEDLVARLKVTGQLPLRDQPRWPMVPRAFAREDRFRIKERHIANLYGTAVAKRIVGLNALRFFMGALPVY